MYSYGIPKEAILIIHIIVGAFLIYCGKKIYYKEQCPKGSGIALAILGIVAIFYHSHLSIRVEDDLMKND